MSSNNKQILFPVNYMLKTSDIKCEDEDDKAQEYYAETKVIITGESPKLNLNDQVIKSEIKVELPDTDDDFINKTVEFRNMSPQDICNISENYNHKKYAFNSQKTTISLKSSSPKNIFDLQSVPASVATANKLRRQNYYEKKQPMPICSMEETFECRFCDFTTASKNQFIHISSNNKRSTYTCTLCGYQCFWKGHLLFHITVEHEKIKKYRCSFCDYVSVRNKYFRRHMLLKHEKKITYQCEFCDLNCDKVEDLRHHKYTKHKMVKQNFECNYCK